MRRFRTPVSRTFTVVVALVAASTLALGACSGDSKDSSEGNGKATSTSTTTTTTFKFAGHDSKAWCEADRKFQEQFAQPAPEGSPVEKGRARFKETVAALDELHDKASDEIRDAVATIRSAYRKVGPALEKAGYDPNKLAPDDQKILSNQKTNVAADRLGAYERQVCKYDPSKPPGTGSTPSTTG